MTRFKNVASIEHFIGLVQAKVDRVVDINLVNLGLDDLPLPPPDFQPNPRNGFLWCPHCGEPRHFYPDPTDPSYLLCEVCRISDAMRTVRNANHLDLYDLTKPVKKKKKKKENAQ